MAVKSTPALTPVGGAGTRKRPNGAQEVSGAVVELDVDRPPAAVAGVSSAGELGSTDVEEAAEAAGGGCGAGAGGGRGVGAPEGTVAAAVERLERRPRRRETTRKTSGG